MTFKADLYLYDLALDEYEFYRERFDNEVYKCRRTGELRLARYLIDGFVLESYCEGGWHLVEAREDLGVIIGYDLIYRYWFVQRNGQVDIFPGAIGRKPVRVVTNGTTDQRVGPVPN